MSIKEESPVEFEKLRSRVGRLERVQSRVVVYVNAMVDAIESGDYGAARVLAKRINGYIKHVPKSEDE